MNKMVGAVAGVVAVVVVIAVVFLFVMSAGAGTPLLTKSQSSSIFGTNGNYSAVTLTSQAEIGAIDQSIPSSLLSGITKAWSMNYSSFQSAPFYAVREVVFESQNPNGLYTYFLETVIGPNPGAFSTVNATLDGMTYSYGESTSVFNGTALVGVEGDSVVIFVDSKQDIGANQLVPAIAKGLS